MARAALVEEKIQAGKKLIDALDQAEFPIRSAFWLRSSEDDVWRLVIGSALVRERGPREAYRRLHSVLASLGDVPLSLSEISLVKDTEPMVDLIRRAVSTESHGTSSIRFTGNTVSGVHIDDAVIYRST